MRRERFKRLFLFIVFLFVRSSFAQDAGIFMHAVVEEAYEITSEKTPIFVSDDTVKETYEFFKSVILKATTAENVAKISQLQKKIDAIIISLSESQVILYGDLLYMMRDMLSIYSGNISEAMAMNNTAAVYFYTPYSEWVKYVDEEFDSIFTGCE